MPVKCYKIENISAKKSDAPNGQITSSQPASTEDQLPSEIKELSELDKAFEKASH